MMIIVYNIQALSGCSADGSVLGSGPRGRGFKSRCSDQKEPVHIRVLVLFCLRAGFEGARAAP